MTVLYVTYSATSLLAVAVFTAILMVAVRHRQVPGSAPVAVLMVALLGYSLPRLLLSWTTQPQLQHFLFSLFWGFAPWAGPAVLAIVLHALGKGAWLTRPRLLLLGCVPLATDLMLLVRPSLFTVPVDFRMVEGFVTWGRIDGFWFPVANVVLFGQLLGTLGLLFWRALHGKSSERRLLGCLFLGLAPAVAANLLGVLLGSGPGRNYLITLSNIPIALGFAAAVFRFRLLPLPPLASKLLGTLRDPIFVADASRHLLFVNDAGCALVGRPRESLLGRDLDEVLPHEMRRLMDEGTGLHPDSDPPESREVALTDAMGNAREFQMSRQWHRDWYGAGTVVSVMHDITGLRRSEEERRRSEEKFRLAFDNANSGMCLVDLEGRLLQVNEKMTVIFGHSRSELQGMTVNDLALADDTAVSPTFIRHAVAGDTDHAEFEKRYRHRDGHVVHAIVSSSLVRDARGQPDFFISQVLDITERKRIEAELDAHRNHLEALVQARTAELEAAKVAAEASSSAKTTFLANMSHELRTPLNGIMGMTALALRRATDQKQIDHLNKAQTASTHLLDIISDILDVARIEAGRIDVASQPFTIADVVERAVGMLSPEASVKGLTVTLEVSPAIGDTPLVGDPLRLGQVLLDLGGNAIKFTDVGDVTLRAAVAHDDADNVLVRFEVADTGIGITEGDQKRLFAPFVQLDMSSTRRHGGTGLGLYVAKGLVELMGGSIGVTSRPGIGSTFWFTARFRKSTPQCHASIYFDEPAEAELRRVCSGAPILVVEDDPLNRDVAREMLEAAGLKVDSADDGNKAVDLAARNDYAAILMDVKMPVMDGLEATRRIRQLPNRGSLPILAMTAYAFEDDRTRCLEAGMNDYLTKPIEQAALYAMLLKWIASRK